jgi:hypothetical protein
MQLCPCALAGLFSALHSFSFNLVQSMVAGCRGSFTPRQALQEFIASAVPTPWQR